MDCYNPTTTSIGAKCNHPNLSATVSDEEAELIYGKRYSSVPSNILFRIFIANIGMIVIGDIKCIS